MRLKSSIWVAAYIRRCNVEGAFAAVRKPGAEGAGAFYIIVNRLDGTATRYGPAPQATFDDDKPTDRSFTIVAGRDGPAPEADVEARVQKEIRFDPDLWIVECEDRAGRHFLDRIVA